MGENAIWSPMSDVASHAGKRRRHGPPARAVLSRTCRTAAISAVLIAAVQPETLDALSSAGRRVLAVLPLLSLLGALALTLLGRKLALASTWPLGLLRLLVVLGWALAGSVVLSRAVTTVEPDFAVTVVNALTGAIRTVQGL